MAVAASRDGPLSSLLVSALLPFLIASASVPDVVTAVEASAAVAQQHVYDLICNGRHSSSKFYFIITVSKTIINKMINLEQSSY